jgi:hypothetical protein
MMEAKKDHLVRRPAARRILIGRLPDGALNRLELSSSKLPRSNYQAMIAVDCSAGRKQMRHESIRQGRPWGSDADPVIGKCGMHGRISEFGHMASHAQLDANRAGSAWMIDALLCAGC